MAGFGKWIGGGVGWALGGPIGALLGFALGSAFDRRTSVSIAGEYERTRGPVRTQSGDFNASLLVLAAAVMKADGRHLKSELEYIRQFFLTNFGKNVTDEMMDLLRRVLEEDIPVNDVSRQVARFMDYASRLQLMHFLFGVARADKQIHPLELQILEQIGVGLGLRPADYQSVRAMFIKETGSAYKVLEITPDASDDEVKKAYRRMATKYHPDKVSHLGHDIQESAKRKFQDLQNAYENIKNERGMK